MEFSPQFMSCGLCFAARGQENQRVEHGEIATRIGLTEFRNLDSGDSPQWPSLQTTRCNGAALFSSARTFSLLRISVYVTSPDFSISRPKRGRRLAVPNFCPPTSKSLSASHRSAAAVHANEEFTVVRTGTQASQPHSSHAFF
jgi:hypothetical protein